MTQKKTCDFIVEGDYVLTMDSQRRIIEQGAVAVTDDRIVAVDAADTIHGRYQAQRIIPGDKKIVTPGLVNGHTHTAMSLFRGMADDLPLMTWLHEHIFPAEAHCVDKDFVRIGATLACYEMIRSGTTTFVDMYFYPECIAEVTRQSGMRAIIGAPVMDFSTPDAADFNAALSNAGHFIRRWQSLDNRILPALAPHSPYTVSGPHLEACRTVAEKLQSPLIIHVAEAPSETAFIQEKYGTTPVRYLDNLGFWDQPVIAAHMVHLERDEIDLVAEKGVGCIHNPASNMKLVSGCAKITDMLEAGVPVGLGTDGAASNNNLDLFREMHLAALWHKHETANPEALDAVTALALATCEGARAIGLGDVTGSLEVKKQADLIQIDFSEPESQPLYDPYSHLAYVFTGRHVVTSMVAGQLLMENRQVLTLESTQLIADTDVSRRRIKNSFQSKNG